MKTKRHLLSGLIVFATSAAITLGADITWDTAATVGIDGGSGDWNTTATNWTTDGGNTNIPWDNTLNATDAALFTAGTGRVTLTEDSFLKELRISSTATSTIGGRGTTNYVFDGPGSLQFGSQQGILDTTASGLITTHVGANLLGSGGLVINATGAGSGNGWLMLAGNNSGLTGGIRVDSGLLGVSTATALGSNTITLNGGGLFTNANRSGPASTEIAGPANLVLANDLVVNNVAGNLIRTWGGRNVIFTGTVSGDGGFDKSDGGAAFIRSSSLTTAITLSGGALWLNQLHNGGQITISGNNTLGYLGTGETTNRVVNFSTGNGGNIAAHGNLNFTSNMTGANAAMGITVTGGGVATMNGITNTGALVNFNKGGLGIWTVNGDLTPNGGNIRPQGGILSFSATSSTTGDAILTAGNRSNGGIIRFATGSSIKSASANTNGVLGGWATFDNTTWAKTNGSGNAIDGLTTFTDDAWAAGNNTTVTLAGADPAAGSTTNSLRFHQAGAKTLTLSDTNTLTSGGLMVTSSVGANNTTITGGTLAGANTLDLAIHQFNTGGNLTISSIIANNTGATGLTKTGAGTVVLSGANTYTGTTRVFEGTLRVTGNNGNKFYEVGSQGRLELDIDGGTSGYGRGILVNGAGVVSTNGAYLAGGRNFNFQSTLRLAGAPTTVRQYGTGAAVLYGFDTNGTHLALENSASGSVIGTNVNYQPGSYGYVMNIAPGFNTATGDLTIQGVFAGGTNGNGTHYRKVGFGSLRIEGAGTATTPFQIRQGSVILAGGNNRLGSGSSMRLGEGADSGLLVLEGVDQTFTALTNAGTGTDNRVVGGSATLSTLTINNAGDTTLAAHLGGTGVNDDNLALTKTGASVLSLGGTNTYTGATTVTAGSLRLDYSVHNNSKLSDTGTLTLGGNLVLDGGSHVEVVGGTVVTGAVTVSRTSGSSVIDFGALTRTGTATLSLAAAGIARTSTPNGPEGFLPSWITIDGSPAANDGSGNIVVYVPAFTDVFRLGGQISNNPSANVRIVDGGTTGPVTLASSGLSDIFSLTQNATGGPATVSLGNGDTLRLAEIGTITAAPGASPLTIQGGALTAGGANATPGTLAVTGEGVVTLACALVNNGDGPLALLKSGPGSLTLNGSNDHTGGVTLNAGQLLLGDEFCLGFNGSFNINGGAIDNVTGDALVITDAIPQFWNGDFTFLGSDDLTFELGGITVTGNRQITIAASTLQINSPVSGSSGFTKLGAGRLLLNHTGNNWTGSTTVSGGTLEIPTRSNDGAYVVNQGGTLLLGYTTGGGYASTNLKLNGDGIAATTGLYLRGGTSYNASGTIELLAAPTTIRHYGTGLAGIGMFDVNGNGLNVSAAASGSQIDANIQMVSRGYGMSMTVASGANTATGDLVIHGPLNVGDLGFYKRGTGSVLLNQAATTSNTAVRIQGGTIIAGTSNVLGANADLPISAGASLRLNGFDQTARNLSGAGSVINGGAGPAVLEIQQTTATTFSGILGGTTPGENAFSIVKDGTATLTLTGINTYTGNTTVKQGTLSLGQASLSDASHVLVTTGATLNLAHGEVDTVGSLFIDGVQQPVGTYHSGNSAFITGTGSLLVTSGSSGGPFATWASSNGLDGSPGKEAGFNDDPDGDGVANGLEWILGGNPLDGQSGSLITTTASASGGLTLSFTRNEDSIGVATLAVDYNASLASPWNSAIIGATSSGPDANGVTVTINAAATPDTVTVTIPASNAPAGKLFGRLKATQP
jgi:fibronectin-binding autotransporter adhesin